MKSFEEQCKEIEENRARERRQLIEEIVEEVAKRLSLDLKQRKPKKGDSTNENTA